MFGAIVTRSMMPPEKDYAAEGRPNYGGPLGISEASRAAKEAADQWKAIGARVLELLNEFAERYRWLLFTRKK
jgi:hypothetical protein